MMHDHEDNRTGRRTGLTGQTGERMAAPVYFTHDECLLGAIDAVRDASEPAGIEVADAGRVVIDPAAGLFWPENGSLDRLAATPEDRTRIEPVPRTPDAGEGRPLEELCWYAGYSGPDGALLERCHPYDVVRLVSWPNFPRLPHAEQMLTLCSLLARRPTSISFAYRMLRMSRADAFRFYSAARAGGHVEVVSSQPTQPGVESADEAREDRDDAGSFWARLFNRISGL